MNLVEFSRYGSKKSGRKLGILGIISTLDMLSLFYLPKEPIFVAASLLVATVCFVAILVIIYRE